MDMEAGQRDPAFKMRESIDSLCALGAKALELAIHFLERTWAGSVAEALVGKAVVVSALFAVLRYVRALQVNADASGPAQVD